MKIALTPEVAELVRARISSGRYADASAVIHEALELLDERDRLQDLRAALAVGHAQLERGEGVPLTPELLDQIEGRVRRG
jgi:antitoxin ParD1/3/4